MLNEVNQGQKEFGRKPHGFQNCLYRVHVTINVLSQFKPVYREIEKVVTFRDKMTFLTNSVFSYHAVLGFFIHFIEKYYGVLKKLDNFVINGV